MLPEYMFWEHNIFFWPFSFDYSFRFKLRKVHVIRETGISMGENFPTSNILQFCPIRFHLQGAISQISMFPE